MSDEFAAEVLATLAWLKERQSQHPSLSEPWFFYQKMLNVTGEDRYEADYQFYGDGDWDCNEGGGREGLYEAGL